MSAPAKRNGYTEIRCKARHPKAPNRLCNRFIIELPFLCEAGRVLKDSETVRPGKIPAKCPRCKRITEYEVVERRTSAMPTDPLPDPFREDRKIAADFWIFACANGFSVEPGADPLGDVLGLLMGPVIALQTYGFAQEVWEKLGEISRTAIINRDWPQAEEKRKATHEPLNDLYNRMYTIGCRLRDAEQELEQQGWRYDPATRKLKALSEPGRPGRPPSALRVLVAPLVERFEKEYKERTGKAYVGKRKELYKTVRERLEPFFAPELVTPGAVKQAVDDHIKHGYGKNTPKSR